MGDGADWILVKGSGGQGGGGGGNYAENEWRAGMRFRMGCWEGFIKYGAGLI